ncbi:hypothetical protein C7M84_019733 [Penaeus vannamei]|uniref:Uncharacterized protein n=1 Tax=Penaeus vannamei TaxID=6689 RepID=A0A3R7PDQ3_PENVA|nr:hypothetical protein C7M84_019733 [Penaeus vannamei]
MCVVLRSAGGQKEASDLSSLQQSPSLPSSLQHAASLEEDLLASDSTIQQVIDAEFFKTQKVRSREREETEDSGKGEKGKATKEKQKERKVKRKTGDQRDAKESLGEGHEVYVLQESRQFTGVGRPTSLLPPNTTGRRRLTPSHHNRTRVFSSDLSASSAKHKSLSELLLQEGTAARHQRRSPATLAPPVYKPGPAVVKFAPDLDDLRKAGLVGQLEIKKVTKGKTIEDGEISERIQKLGRKRNSETETKIPDYVSSTTFRPKFVYKDVGTQSKKISTFDGVSEEMALYVETAQSPTYSLSPQALRRHRRIGPQSLDLRQYNLSSQGPDLTAGVGAAALRRQQFVSQRLSPTSSSFIPPVSPLSDRSAAPRGNRQSLRPLVIVATPRPVLTPKTYALDSTTPKPRSSTRPLRAFDVRARERVDLTLASPAPSPFYEPAALSRRLSRPFPPRLPPTTMSLPLSAFPPTSCPHAD